MTPDMLSVEPWRSVVVGLVGLSVLWALLLMGIDWLKLSLSDGGRDDT